MLSFFLVILGLAGACTPPDCDNVDLGTCVEACCKLEWYVPDTSASVLSAKLAAAFKSKGPDGRYEFWAVATDQGPLSFVVQGKHYTINDTYVDSLSFGIYNDTHPTQDAVIVQAFSHSQDFIVGDFAYGDRGQNYKNLVYIFKSLNVKYKERILIGCPKPSLEQ